MRYPCDQCEYLATQHGHLKKHKKQAKFDGVKYQCDHCEYIHETKYEGLRYTREQCEDATTQPSRLKRHKKEKH